MKTEAFFKGYEDKTNEIQGMGFNAARDKLNMDYPAGEKWTGSKDGFDYMQGQAEALHKSIK